MIDVDSLSKEWLAERRKTQGGDPELIEKMIHALYLLEQLKLTGLDFIFKGGTSLILLMDQPSRFSIDLDIIVSPDITREKLEEFLNKIAINTNVFIRIQLDEKRSYKNGIPKAHYSFFFNSSLVIPNKESQISPNPEREISLDILFVENPYPVLLEKPFDNEWIKLKGEPLTVKTPCVNSITGDKLTAFAPNTTGVPYHRKSINKDGLEFQNEMFKEVIKQLFDISCLFEAVDDIGNFRKAYEKIAQEEIKYRIERNIKSQEEVLNDTISTALILAMRDKHTTDSDIQNFAYLSQGINQFKSFVYTGHFRIEHAQLAGAKAAYLAAIILKKDNGPLKRFDEKIPVAEYSINHPDYAFLNKKLKFVLKGEALFYWNEVVKLLHP